MSSYLFRWPHPASEVFVTGTFDDWGKTVRLEKKGNAFEKLVRLPEAGQNIYYKFVVDGVWTTDHTAPQENDGHNNLNNVLTPEDVNPSQQSQKPSTAFMSGVTPQSTSASLAQQVPLETKHNDMPISMPGEFPETPFQERSEFNPAPDVPMPTPSRGEAQFGVNPLPGTAGMRNPIQLKPGERVPHPSSITANKVTSGVTLDKESYERGDSTTNGLPMLPPVVTPQEERDRRGTGVLDLPPITQNLIPESSLPMGDGNPTDTMPGAFDSPPAPSASQDAADAGPGSADLPSAFTSSAAPSSSTAELAAKVPLEARKEAPELPGAFTSSAAPSSSTAELAAKVPLEVDRESPKLPGAFTSSAAPSSSTADLAAKIPLETDRDTPHTASDRQSSQAPSSLTTQPASSKAPLDASEDTPHVPGEFDSSEAPTRSTTQPAASQTRREAEKDTNDMPGGFDSAETPSGSSSRPTTKTSTEADKDLPNLPGTFSSSAVRSKNSEVQLAAKIPLEDDDRTPDVPGIVKDSQQKAHVQPEASASAEAVEEKRAVEEELTKAVQPALPTAEGVAREKEAERAPDVPELVKDSQQKAHVEPEASASAEAVEEKRAVEEELSKAVKPTQPTVEGVAGGKEAGTTEQSSGRASIGSGERSTPTVAAPSSSDNAQQDEQNSDYANLPPSVLKSIQEMNLNSTSSTTVAAGVPEVVTKSINEAHQSPEAASNDEAVAEKRAVEHELLEEVKPAESAGNLSPMESKPGLTRDTGAMAEETAYPDPVSYTTGDEGTVAPSFAGVNPTTPGPSYIPEGVYTPLTDEGRVAATSTGGAPMTPSVYSVATPAADDGRVGALTRGDPLMTPSIYSVPTPAADEGRDAPTYPQSQMPTSGGSYIQRDLGAGGAATTQSVPPTEETQAVSPAPMGQQATAPTTTTTTPATNPMAPGGPTMDPNTPQKAAAAAAFTPASSATSTPQNTGHHHAGPHAPALATMESPGSSTSKREKRLSGFLHKFDKLKEKLRK